MPSIRETFAEDRSDNDERNDYCDSSQEELRNRQTSRAVVDFNDLIEPKDSDDAGSENKDEYNP